MNTGRHHELTEFELRGVAMAQELSRAVKGRADLEVSPQIALAKLCRDMGARKALEILREIDSPTPKGPKR